MKRQPTCECCEDAVGPGPLSLHLKELSVDYMALIEAADCDDLAMRELVSIERTVDDLFQGMSHAETIEHRLALGVLKELVTRFGPRRTVH